MKSKLLNTIIVVPFIILGTWAIISMGSIGIILGGVYFVTSIFLILVLWTPKNNMGDKNGIRK